MVDKEVEQAVIAAFEEILTGRQGAELPPVGIGGSDQSEQTARELEALSQEVHNIAAGPLYGLTSSPTNGKDLAPPATFQQEPAVTGAHSIVSNTTRTAKASAGEQEAGVGSGILHTVLKAGLGTVPLVRLVAGLFGSDDAEAPPPLLKYAAPPAIRLERANADPRDGRLTFAEFDYDQEGHTRRGPSLPAVIQQEPSQVAQADTAPVSHITVNVQAIDSRSFLDHSNDIALAVREAMLNMHALNDVVSDL